MDLRLISRVLFLRAAWRKRDHWDAARIAAHQAHALQELAVPPMQVRSSIAATTPDSTMPR
ncbi:hypothetical protein [[Micrococcus luteus] ATCC 49442]|uniref:hypothetical protein n=1 Tax=[Micrococcus luteus] ATCC 49442 TaxID=2698727 RepID=UPI001FCAF144|nr:hypothetical protein [[Micrococcus luteus] ATCC 49442]